MNTPVATATTPSTTATPSPDEAPTAPTSIRSLIGTGVLASVAAGVLTVGVSALATAAGASLTIQGEPIPLVGIGQLTVLLSLVGIVIAAVCARRSRTPRSTFVAITVVLTIVSLAAPLVTPADAATKAVLDLAHVIAAAVVISALAHRLPR